MNQIRDDLNERVREKLLHWMDDSQQLYDIAEILDGHAHAHMVYCLLCALTAVLVKAGISKADACRMLIAMMDRTHNIHHKEKEIEL